MNIKNLSIRIRRDAINRVSTMAIAALAFAACNSDDAPVETRNLHISTINVTAQGFSGEGIQTRASDAGYTTTFALNDRIGITAVSGGVIVSGQDNLPYRYNGTAWEAVGNAVNNYPGATYFACYPYDAGMNGKTSAVDILAAFAPQADQSTQSGYTASDLMTGAGAVSGSTLSITLTHALALLETVMPAPAATGVTLTVNGVAVKPYKYAPDVYRYICKSASSIGGDYVLGGKSYEWSKTGVTASPGKYTRIDVSHPQDGSEYGPWLIYTTADLQKIGTATGWTRDKHYKLMADLTLNSAAIPGTYSTKFDGTFDGNGHTLTINNEEEAFTYIGATGVVKNIRLNGVTLVQWNDGTIRNCCNSTSINSGLSYNFFGLFAASNYGLIENCYSTGNITINTNQLLGVFLGGIAGYNETTGVIRNCYSTGNISGTNTTSDFNPVSMAGGISSVNDGNISYCVALGASVTATANETYVGRISNYETVSNCFANASMSLTGTQTYAQNGTDITSAQWESQAWWSGTANFAFGGDEEHPWVWDSATKRPKLWWE